MADGTRGGSNDAALPLIATDDVSGTFFQRIKLDLGGDGVSTPVVDKVPVDLGADNDVTVTGSVTASLAAGANNIGDVDVLTLPALVAGTANIGDVDVLTVPADPFGVNADAANATGSISAKLRFIAATGIPITGTVTVGSHAVTNAGTFAVQAAGDTAHDAVDAGNPVKMGGYASTAAPTAVAAGDRVNAWLMTDGRQVVTIAGTGGVAGTTVPADTVAGAIGASVWAENAVYNGTNWDRMRGDITNGLDVDVTRLPALVAGSANIGDVDVASIAAGDNNIGNVDIVSLPALVAGTANIGDVDVLTVPADPFGANADAGSTTGSISAKLKFIAATGIPITGTVTVGSHAVTNAGTFAVQSAGGTAADAALTASPVTVGARASAATPTAMSTDGDVVNLWATTRGALNTRLVDANGDAVSVGGGTQYTQDNALGTTPIGTVSLGRANDAAPTAVSADGDAVALWTSQEGALNVILRDVNGVQLSSGGNGLSVQGAVEHDDGYAGYPIPIGAYASVAAPTVVSADGDSTRLWATRFGALNTRLVDAAGDAVSVGGGTQYVEDVALGATPIGTLAMAVGSDAVPTAVTADGDAVALWASPEGALNVTLRNPAGSSIDLLSDGYGLVMQGPVAHDAAVGGNPVLMGARANLAAPPDVADGDAVDLWATRYGALATVLTDSNGFVLGEVNPVSVAANGTIAHDAVDSGAPVKMGGYASAAAPANVSADGDRVNGWFLRSGAQATVLTAAGALIGGDATNGLDVDVTRLPALVAGTANIGDVDVLTVPADPFGANADAGSATGSISAKLRFIAATGIPITGTVTVGSHAVTNAGTFAVQAAGDVAHDSVDSGSPQKVGFAARSTFPAAVADADRVNGTADLFGRQLVSHIDPALHVSKSFNATTTQTGIDVWDPAAGKRIAITSIVIGAYGTTAGRVILWFGDNADTTFSAGTDQQVLAASFAPSATAKPGLVLTPAVPIFCTTADRELHITTDAAISIDVSVHGYEY